MTVVEFFSLLGGVGLFLFGMSSMSSGLRAACGNRLQAILEKATSNKVVAVLVGTGITMLIQSSSATEAMVIGFANAMMMNMAQSVGVIMGANIGTTITAQITAFNLSDYATLLLFIGAIMFLFIKRTSYKAVGEIIMGFGMLFVGISIMKTAMAPLSQSQSFVSFMTGLENPLVAILFGIAFTALLQSQSSSTVIFQTFAIQGLISFDTAVYLVMGACIGAVTPNLLAALTVNRDGKRAAMLNLVYNTSRVVVLSILINIFPQMLEFIKNLSPDDIGRQVANINTIFAIISVIIFLPFTNFIIKGAEFIIPVKGDDDDEMKARKLQYMINLNKMPPSMAMRYAQMEIARMGRIATKNLRKALECFFDYDQQKAEKIHLREDTVNILNHTIADAMVQLQALELGPEILRRISQMSLTVNDIERLSDHAENIIEYAEQLKTARSKMSKVAVDELHEMANDTLTSVDLAIDIFEKEDYSKLKDIEELEAKIDNYEATLINNHIGRLMKNNCHPLTGVIFTDIVTDLERCGDHAINIAYSLKNYPMDILSGGKDAAHDD